MRSFIKRSVFAAILLSLSSCLFTSQHFNTGKILLPGEKVNSYGLTRGPLYFCDGDLEKDSKGHSHCVEYESDWGVEHISESSVPSFSIGWRLGVRESWGPLTGVDFGYHIEFPGTLDFDVRWGLPNFKIPNFYHNVSTGWGIGAWADNNWFVEYAAGYELLGRYILYANFRETWLSTQFADLTLNAKPEEDIFKHARSFMHQLSVGTRVNFAATSSLLPTYLHVNAHYGFPQIMLFGIRPPKGSSIDKVYSRINVGLEWKR